MASNEFLLLGIPGKTSLLDLQHAYADMLKALRELEANCTCGASQCLSSARQQLMVAIEELELADISSLSSAHDVDGHNLEPDTSTGTGPKLGQILVSMGLITLEELQSALTIQRNTKTSYVPLGDLLVGAGYITPQQLDYYLRMQELLSIPSDRPERWGQRLVEHGLVTEDQLKVALVEQKTTGCTLRQALINRGWLTAQVLDRIF